MFLVLTYHRILKDCGACSGFFDVSARELQGHLSIATRSWGRCASPGDLLQLQDGRDRKRRGFLMTFDDGTEDHYATAAPILEANNARGVFFVNTSRLGREGYLSIEQCQELQARGHAIESHGHEHKRLTGLAPGLLHRQLAESRRRLRELNLGRHDFLAPTGGSMDDEVVQAARAEGYKRLRSLGWGYNRGGTDTIVESITLNRRTAQGWFGLLASPRFERAKKALYRSKELLKGGSFGSLYFGLREFSPARTTVSGVLVKPLPRTDKLGVRALPSREASAG